MHMYVWYMGCRHIPTSAFKADWNPGSNRHDRLACNESVWIIPNLVNPYG